MQPLQNNDMTILEEIAERKKAKAPIDRMLEILP